MLIVSALLALKPVTFVPSWKNSNVFEYNHDKTKIRHKQSLDSADAYTKPYFKLLKEYRRELREFRRKIEKMIEIEDARADEFDLRYKKELQLREAELFRRKEFDIKNGSPF